MDYQFFTEQVWKLFFVIGDLKAAVLLWFGLAIGLALAIHTVTILLLQRMLVRDSPGGRILARSRGITRLAALLIGLIVALPIAELDLQISDAVQRLIKIAFAALLGWLAVLAINISADTLAARHDIGVEDDLEARRALTQIGLLRRVGVVIAIALTVGGMLMSFPAVESIGVSLFASAGVASIILGFAARPVLSNLFAGIQLALTQPVRINDVVIVEGEWGVIEEITMTYIVIRIWDLRRMVVPISHFIEKPFENWTRHSSSLIGSITWHVDYTVPLEEMRGKLTTLVEGHPCWDGNLAKINVVDAAERTIKVRAIVSASNSSHAWDLRCHVREGMIEWLKTAHPDALPLLRARIDGKLSAIRSV